jgi:hypothetical protein
VSFVNVNKVSVASCTFRGNRADYGAAAFVGYGASPVLAGNVFHDNTAVVNGSALFSVYSYPKLLYNTIVSNECLPESEFYVCGAVENFNGKVLLVGNIIRGNITNHYSGLQVVEPRDYDTHYNNIEAYIGNPTNLDQPVHWTAQGAHPYQLMQGALEIDEGIDHPLAVQLASLDPAGNDRLCDSMFDLGAYEYCGGVSGVADQTPVAQAIDLECWPNPFNPRTSIRFGLTEAARVNLSIYDLHGRRVRQVVNEQLPAGEHAFLWKGRDESGQELASGTYLVRLTSTLGTLSQRVVLLK